MKAYVSVNKALVTQSSSAIPIVPLYISILYKVMKAHGNHEGCIEQDEWEMLPEIQSEVTKAWESLSADNFKELTDIDGYWSDFYAMFGFGIDGVDYEADVEV